MDPLEARISEPREPFQGDFAELEAEIEALRALLRKLLIEAPDGGGYVGKPEPWPTGGYSLVLDHGVSLTDAEAEFVRRVQEKSA